MDSRYCAQDVLRCDLCDSPGPPMFCDNCYIKLCKACVGEHISDESKEHKVVPFRKRGSTPKCPKHSTKLCNLHCEQCNIPICLQCVSSEHQGHKTIEIMKIFTNKKEAIRKDLQELEKSIYPRYQIAASKMQIQRADVRKNSQLLTTGLEKQREALHTEIDAIIQKIQAKIDRMESKHLAAIDQQEDGINNTITEMKQIIADIKKMLDSDDVFLISGYKSRNEKFRSLPGQFQITMPTFRPQKINREQIYQLFGSLSNLVITAEGGGPLKTSYAESTFPSKQLIKTPQILTDIKTEYGKDHELCNVSLLNDREIWTFGNEKIMRLYNLHGQLMKSVQTRSGQWPTDIAVIQSGDLVYTDFSDRSINIVEKTGTHPLIRLLGWIPLCLCSTSSGDILFAMINDDYKETKVVRYAGLTEKQSIQWDDRHQPIYSSNSKNHTKHLSENKTFDICVSDCYAGAVVVVSEAGKLRFRYTGPPSATKKQFKPMGIKTDSMNRILTADISNKYIHILDKDGHFLRYIDNCGLQFPHGLKVDSDDNLFVAEYKANKVRKIKYCK